MKILRHPQNYFIVLFKIQLKLVYSTKNWRTDKYKFIYFLRDIPDSRYYLRFTFREDLQGIPRTFRL